MTTQALPAGTRPFAFFEWMLASRYIRARRQEGFLSVFAAISILGITLAVATLIIVVAVLNGFRKELYEKILGIRGHVYAVKIAEPFADWEDISARLAMVPGVKAVLPNVQGQVMASSNANFSGAIVYGHTESSIKSLPIVAENVRFGSLDAFDRQGGIAIGIRLANRLNINVGDNLTLISPRGPTTALGTVPRTKPYPVAAIFELGMTEFDSSMIFMPLGEAQKFFNRAGVVDYLEVMIDNPEDVASYLEPLRTAAGESIQLSDWRQHNSSFLTLLKVERITMSIILSLIVLVAALNIISGLMMLVKDKGRDIAVLRTMGASRGAMMRVFLITGTSIGVTGTLLGLLAAIIFCWNIESIRQFVAWVTNTEIFDPSFYLLTRMPAHLDPVDTSVIVLMAVTLSVLATLYPSWRASTLDPVEALRYE